MRVTGADDPSELAASPETEEEHAAGVAAWRRIGATAGMSAAEVAACARVAPTATAVARWRGHLRESR